MSLPVPRADMPPDIAAYIAPPAQSSRFRRAITALLADHSPTPAADAIDEVAANLLKLAAFVRSVEEDKARREQARGLWRWRG